MRHRDLTLNHKIENWTFADQAEREALPDAFPEDIGKIAYQEDNQTYWRLEDDSPLSWIQAMAGPAGADGANGTDGADGADGANGAPGVGVPVGGTTGQILEKASNTDHDTQWADPPVGGGGGLPQYVLIQDQKAQNTNGGTATSGSWLKRDLTTIVTDTDGNVNSLVSSEFELDAGTYRVLISVPAMECQRHQARLFNVTDATVTLLGTSEFSQTTDASLTRSIIVGQFTIAAAKTFRVEQRFSAPSGNNYVRGLGANFTTEIYTVVELFK